MRRLIRRRREPDIQRICRKIRQRFQILICRCVLNLLCKRGGGFAAYGKIIFKIIRFHCVGRFGAASGVGARPGWQFAPGASPAQKVQRWAVFLCCGGRCRDVRRLSRGQRLNDKSTASVEAGSVPGASAWGAQAVIAALRTMAVKNTVCFFIFHGSFLCLICLR